MQIRLSADSALADAAKTAQQLLVESGFRQIGCHIRQT
jgi:hypothetical protein